MTFLARNLWSLSYDLKEGGLVLNDVRHDSFSLARDFRVTRLWVGTGRGGGNKLSYVLNAPALPAQGPPALLGGPGANASSPFPFDVYRTMFGLDASFRSSAQYLVGTPNACDVEVRQRYLFGDYGKNPPHEPGAVLDAARLFPLLDFSFPAVSNLSQPYPTYFRADYRVDVALDNLREIHMMMYNFRPGATQDRALNKAGMFRDKEALGVGWPGLQTIFAAYEKPMKYEAATWGLVESGTHVGVYKDKAWDNMHMWPADKGATSEPISTPGAFHAFHCHWRWGAVSGAAPGFFAKRVVPSAGQPQFKGLGWTEASGGPLIDARIPKQDLIFAVTRNDPDWAADKNPSGEDFLWMFQGKRRPEVIERGDDLVFWLSFGVHRDERHLQQPWKGTLFIHGLYFPHGQDLTPLAVKYGGGYDDGASPAPQRIWERPSKY